jgi:para-nitrobenzyl esterase
MTGAFALIVSSTLVVLASDTAPEVVRVSGGAIRGLSNNGLLIYKGVPYAAAPQGALRWRPPQPAAPWDGVRDAAQFGPACIQPVPEAVRKLVRMSEDCLSLNVWRPVNAANLPVMVWVHGGGFRGGTGSNVVFDGTALASTGVGVVTLNYRLGPFGLFAHRALGAKPGERVANYHLMDQIAALEWVHRHIAVFGGDKDRVTVFGESSGGSSVLALMVSPAARGLFQRAIVQSGTLFHRTLAEVQTEFERAVESAGIDAEQLRTTDAQELVDKLAAATFTPVVDGALIPEAPLKAFEAGRQARVPFMIGVTSDEGSLLGPSGMTADSMLAKVKADDKQLESLYPGLSPRSESLAHALYGDFFYGVQARLLARLTQSAYLYEFGYVPEQLRSEITGVPHGLDVPFVFRNKHPKIPMSEADMRMATTVSSFWLRFARTGNPNEVGADAWPKYEGATDQWLIFENDGPARRQYHRKTRLDFCEPFVRTK